MQLPHELLLCSMHSFHRSTQNVIFIHHHLATANVDFSHIMQLLLELLHLRNIFCHGSTQKVIVVPLNIFLKLVHRPFHFTRTLRLDEAIKVVSVALLRMLDTQQIIQHVLREGHRIMHCIQVVRTYSAARMRMK